MDSDGQEDSTQKRSSARTPATGTSAGDERRRRTREVLTEVEKSVAEGKPVPFDISRKDEDGNGAATA